LIILFYIKRDTGNVGIGTTAPANKLHVVGGNGLTVSGGQPLELISGGTIPVIKWYGNANLTFGNDPNIANIGNGFAGNQLVVITPSGNVGIGTTNPGTKLQVNGPISSIGGWAGITGVPAGKFAPVLTSETGAAWLTSHDGTNRGGLVLATSYFRCSLWCKYRRILEIICFN
jgi:hypothetical protein